DLILMRVPVNPDHEPLKAAAPIFYLHHPSYGESAQSGYAAFVENLRLVSQLTGQPDAAEVAIARFDTVLENLRAISTPETHTLSVAVLFQGEGYRVIGPGNPFCVALAAAQLGQCVGEGDASYEINAEEFLGLDPDWLIYQSGDGSYQDRTDPVWSELSAVKEGRVYDALGNRYYCCSLRGLIHALQEYVHYVVPDANIPAPGPWLDFDPVQSPLLQPAAS
ncbi:MAG: ABC transporter substrate-binding protein, partial [Litorilinea sp.]